MRWFFIDFVHSCYFHRWKWYFHWWKLHHTYWVLCGSFLAFTSTSRASLQIHVCTRAPV